MILSHGERIEKLTQLGFLGEGVRCLHVTPHPLRLYGFAVSLVALSHWERNVFIMLISSYYISKS